MKKLIIPLLFVSTPVFAGCPDSLPNCSSEANSNSFLQNSNKQLDYYTPPMPETEHYYQYRTPEGDVSRGWMRKLD